MENKQFLQKHNETLGKQTISTKKQRMRSLKPDAGIQGESIKAQMEQLKNFHDFSFLGGTPRRDFLDFGPVWGRFFHGFSKAFV